MAIRTTRVRHFIRDEIVQRPEIPDANGEVPILLSTPPRVLWTGVWPKC